MIMALIYRNVPRKKTNEMLLLGERLSAEEAHEAGIVNRVVAAEDFDEAVHDWAAKLASKSPVVMRLGKDAMWRQMDMPLAEALDYLCSQLTIELGHRGRDRGRHRLLRKARAGMEGALGMANVSRPKPTPPLRRRSRGSGGR
jgi:enoyl-CoA hydratase/carnithine racemase